MQYYLNSREEGSLSYFPVLTHLLFLEHIYNILLLLYKFYSLRLSATRNQCRVPPQRLYPVLLYLTNLRALRIHGADGVYPEQADLEILVGNIRIGRFKINVRQVDI